MPTIDFEVRKPKYTFWQTLKKWYYGYSYAYEKWQDRLPNDGDLIQLTNLPNPRNNPFEKSIWIGSKGVVFDMDKSEGNFCLRLESGATLICLSENFTYKLFV